MLFSWEVMAMRRSCGLAVIAFGFAMAVASVARAQPGEAATAPSPVPPADAAAAGQATPQPYAPPPPVAHPVPYPAPYATRPPPAYPAPYPYGYSPWALYEETSKSAGLSFLFEFLMPGVGSIYADHATGAIITWGLMLGGVLLIVNGITTARDPETGATETDVNDLEMATGILMILGGRTYGLVDSIVAARAYNERLRKRLGLAAALRLDALPTAAGGHVLAPALRLTV
jgi:hypothetical protein